MGVYIDKIDLPKDGDYIPMQLYGNGHIWINGAYKGVAKQIDLVRCGECKHYKREVCRLDPFWERYTEPNDFCSQGERRTER